MQLRAEKTRKSILSAARREFAAHGYAGTPIDLIAEQAKVNKQRIYAYFGSKKGLFEAVLLELFAENAARFEAFAATVRQNGDDLTLQLARYYQQLHSEIPEFQRLLSWANLEDAVDPAVLTEARTGENERLRSWFDEEVAAGRLRRDIAPESWLLTLMGTAYFACANARTLRQTLGEKFLDEAARNRRSEDLSRLFRAPGGTRHEDVPVIDCHVHLVAGGNDPAETEHLLRHMRRNGIAMAIASDLGDGWPAFPDAATLRRANERARRAAADHPGELAYLVYLNPQLDNWREELATHRDTACGIKLWISLRAPDGSLERGKAVLREAARLGLPVLIHTFERTGGSLPGEVGIGDVLELARAVPECRIVSAHAGGNWRELIRRVGDFPGNVVWDISGSYPERAMVARLTAACGADRLLYGSDAPGRSFGSQLYKIREAELDEQTRRKILCENACRIFRLPVPAARGRARPQSWPVPSPEEDHFCFVGQAPYWDHSVTLRELVQAGERSGSTRLFAADLRVLDAPDRLRANAEWLCEASREPSLRPLAAVNLRAFDEAMRQLTELNGFAGVWLSPYAHGFKLEYRAFRKFYDRCAQRRIPLWINTALGDDRFRSPELHSRAVSAAEILEFVRTAPPNRYIFQGVGALEELSRQLPEYCFLDCSKLADGEYAPERLFQDRLGDPARLLYGSEYPFRDHGCTIRVLRGDR